MVVDGKVAFVGGIDITDFGGDRFDTSDHPARRRLGWHDVGSRLRGPAVLDVHDHFAMRWREVTGEHLTRPEAPPADGRHTVQIVRTVSEVMYDAVPKGEFRILESYVRALRSATALHLSRKPVPVVAGDRPASSPTSSAIRPATTSGW